MEGQGDGKQPVRASLMPSNVLNGSQEVWEQTVQEYKAKEAQERQKLLDQIAGLKKTAARVDELLRENEHLRSLQIARDDAQTPLTDNDDQLRKGIETINADQAVSTGGGPVPYQIFAALQDKYGRAATQIELLKDRGGKYKAAALRYQQRSHDLTAKLDRSKASVRGWIEYANKVSALMTNQRLSMEEAQAGEGGQEKFLTSPSQRSTPLMVTHHRAVRTSMTPFGPEPISTKHVTTKHTPPELRSASPSLFCVDPSVDLNRIHETTQEVTSVDLNRRHETMQEVTRDLGQSKALNNLIFDASVGFELPTERTLDKTAIDARTAASEHHPWATTMPQKSNRLPRDHQVRDEEGGSQSPMPLELKEQFSSQTTDDDLDPRKHLSQLSLHREPINEEPVFLSARTLKRKRTVETVSRSDHPRPGQSGDGSHRKPFTLKKELNNSSSPLQAAGMAHLHQENSLDLDEVPGLVETPKKNRMRQDLATNFTRRHHNGTNRMRSASMPLEENTIENRLSDSFEAELGEYSSQNEDNTTRGPFITSKRADEDDRLHCFMETSYPQQSETVQRPNEANASKVLQPLSANKRIMPWISKTEKLQRKTSSERHAPRLNALTEDGEQFSSTISKKAGHDGKRQEGFSSPRLNNLLEAPSSHRRILAPAKSFTASNHRPILKTFQPAGTPLKIVKPISPVERSLTPSLPVTNLKKSFSLEKMCVNRSGRYNRGSEASRSGPDEISPEDEPLRARPVNRLGLDDFKINPQYNQGYDFAYSEVVRSREQRKCLPGCTRPECCGEHFRKMVELGGALPAPARGLWDSSEGDDDQRLLEEYLGDDASRLRHMTADEKAELLTKAKADQLAQKHGKHRQAHGRGVSPPGFWRTDFPSTQEIEADREKGKQLERAKVEERYRIAMKCEGQWLFRDE